MKPVPRDQEWLNERRKGIGGSDAAAIMGVNPHASPLSVYMDKLGLAPERDETEAMRQGVDLEQYVAERFHQATGKKVRRVNRILYHQEYDWMLANIDRGVVGETAGLECKTTSVFNKTDFYNGNAPPTYYWQCQHYMAVTGAPHWYLAVLVLNSAFHVFDVPRDDNHIQMLIEKEQAFWFDHVLARNPPFPIGLDCEDELIAALPSEHDEDEVVDLQEYENSINDLKCDEARCKNLEQIIKMRKQAIAMQMGIAVKGRSNRWDVTYKLRTSTRLDTALLKQERPDIWAQYSKASISRPMKIREARQ